MDNHELIEEIIKQVKQPIWSNWVIREKIGVGSYSEVYRVEANRGNRKDFSALKIEPLVADDGVFSPEDKIPYIERKREVANNETKIMHKLRNCPYIVRYEDELQEKFYINGQYEGYYLLIRMELLTCVQDMLRGQEFELSESNVKKLAVDIGKGLIATHRAGILHRDVKPKNLFYSEEGGVYKLGDFNISKKAETTKTFAGADGFIAPEIYRVKQNPFESYTKRADIYSFGITLYILMNDLRFPFENNMDSDQAFDERMSGERQLPNPKNASKEFSKIILKACAFRPEDRYETVEEMVADIERQNSKKSVVSAPISTKISEDNGNEMDGQATVLAQKRKDPYQTVYAESYETLRSSGKETTEEKIFKLPLFLTSVNSEGEDAETEDKRFHLTDIHPSIEERQLVIPDFLRKSSDSKKSDSERESTEQHSVQGERNEKNGLAINISKCASVEALAQQGDAFAQFRLGEMYYYGEGVNEDKAQAIQWIRKSAKQGNAEAQYRLGIMYYYGQGVSNNRLMAAKWFRRAAKQGDVYAQSMLGDIYWGWGINTKAVEWFRKAAEQGLAEAQDSLGHLYKNYYFDHGMKEKYKAESIKWFRMVVEQNDPVFSKSAQGEIDDWQIF